jgi:hypothetical protein
VASHGPQRLEPSLTLTVAGQKRFAVRLGNSFIPQFAILAYAKATVTHREEYRSNPFNWTKLPEERRTLKAEKNLMNAEQIKEEIRKLNRIDKIEICEWIDEQAASDLLSRIGMPGNGTESSG